MTHHSRNSTPTAASAPSSRRHGTPHESPYADITSPYVAQSFGHGSSGSRKSSPSIADQVVYMHPAAALSSSQHVEYSAADQQHAAMENAASRWLSAADITSSAASSPPVPPQAVQPSATAAIRGPSLSAAAVPWYPAAHPTTATQEWLAGVLDVSIKSSGDPMNSAHQQTHGALQPRQEEFPCEPYGGGVGRSSVSMSSSNGVAPQPRQTLATSTSRASLCRDASPPGSVRLSPLPHDSGSETMWTPTVQTQFPHQSRINTGGSAMRTMRNSTSRTGGGGAGDVSVQTPHSQVLGDEDDDYVIMRFRDDEALDEDEMIRRLAEGAFWSIEGPAAEGLHHIRELWEAPQRPRRRRRIVNGIVVEEGAEDDMNGDDDQWGQEYDGAEEDEEDDFSDWEDDSRAYEDSEEEEEQLRWMEEQVRARDNPDDFFF